MAYGDVAGIQQITAIAGMTMTEVSMAAGVGDIWFDLLGSAVRAGKIKRLLAVILDDERIAFYYLQIRKLIA